MKSIVTISQKEVNGIIDYISHVINTQQWKPNIIVTMAKGGLIPARLLAKKLNINKILSFGISFYNDNNQKVTTPIIYQNLTGCKDLLICSNILLVDDIADTGDSLLYCMDHLASIGVDFHNIRTCSLYRKTGTRIIPDFYFNIVDDENWIVMPWE
jgi:hypoxanthine phosphoribosyltransferase